jgi:hypothetical protein
MMDLFETSAKMSIPEIVAWSFAGGFAAYIINAITFAGESRGRRNGLSFAERTRDLLPFAIAQGIQIYAGVLVCILVNYATTPHLSILATVLIGAGVPALISQLTQSFIKIRNRKRDEEISQEVKRLEIARQELSYQPTSRGISDDFEGILRARTRELAGDLPVVGPRDEEGIQK